MLCLTCWNSLEKLANRHSFPALRITPLLYLDFRRQVATEDVRGNQAMRSPVFLGYQQDILRWLWRKRSSQLSLLVHFPRPRGYSVFRIPSTFISTLLWNSFGMGEESRVTCWKFNPWGVYSLTQEAPGIKNKISSLQVQQVVRIHGYPSCYNGQFHFALF